MSHWTYINGTVTVGSMGRTTEESEYILKTVLNHLPRVTGSEGDMDVHIVRKNGYSSSISCDEFGQRTNNLITNRGIKSQRRGWLNVQNEYILVVNGSLRDREFEQIYREFIKWFIRLCKRVTCENVLVEIWNGWDKRTLIQNRNIQNEKYSWQSVFEAIHECPTWCNDSKEKYKEPNWCEFLMWESAKDSRYPMMLGYKYFRNEENDNEVRRRIRYQDEE